MIQIDTAKELDKLVKTTKGLESRTDGIQFLIDAYKKNLEENA